MNNKPIVYVIVGPTASGKSSLGIELAKKLNGEIISADSMQIYKGLDIGTAKANADEQKQFKHHLIDIKNIEDTYSVSDFVRDANTAIENILSKGKAPIVVGGTGLYINALVNNMSFEEEPDDGIIQERIDLIEKSVGVEGLYNYLLQIDHMAAQSIDKNNINRVKRAIKMCLSGNKKSEADNKQNLWKKNGELKYNFYVIKICLPREELYNRINKRVDIMVNEGILNEAKYIKNKKLPSSSTSVKAIGYKEFFDYIDNKKSLEDCVQELKKNTRNYAKRQETWFKKLGSDLLLDGNITKDEQVNIILGKKEELYGKES